MAVLGCVEIVRHGGRAEAVHAETPQADGDDSGERRGGIDHDRPGPFNDLGQIKFMFPNEYRVYLHDTPSKELFLRSRRTFSHGCIRLAEPLELVEHVLEEQWNKEKLQETFSGSSSHVVWLEKKLPVYVLYLTAWAEPTARTPRVHFRDDVYSHDERLWSDLAEEGSKSLLTDFIALLWSGFPDP